MKSLLLAGGFLVVSTITVGVLLSNVSTTEENTSGKANVGNPQQPIQVGSENEEQETTFVSPVSLPRGKRTAPRKPGEVGAFDFYHKWMTSSLVLKEGILQKEDKVISKGKWKGHKYDQWVLRVKAEHGYQFIVQAEYPLQLEIFNKNKKLLASISTDPLKDDKRVIGKFGFRETPIHGWQIDLTFDGSKMRANEYVYVHVSSTRKKSNGAYRVFLAESLVAFPLPNVTLFDEDGTWEIDNGFNFLPLTY